jgi:hypothetical protein
MAAIEIRDAQLPDINITAQAYERTFGIGGTHEDAEFLEASLTFPVACTFSVGMVVLLVAWLLVLGSSRFGPMVRDRVPQHAAKGIANALLYASLGGVAACVVARLKEQQSDRSQENQD